MAKLRTKDTALVCTKAPPALSSMAATALPIVTMFASKSNFSLANSQVFFSRKAKS